MDNQPSAISHQPSAISHQLKTFCFAESCMLIADCWF